MKVMVIVKATKDSEAGVMPSKELLTAMGNYNEELVKAGIMLAGDGLKAIVAGQTGPVLGKQTDGKRRTVRRDQGTRCRLLDLAGSVHGRGRRVVEALSESDARRI